jgi:hypothetical protein
MSRWFALAILAICFAGCRAPQQTFNPLGGIGYGNPCVPPPSTGSVGYGQGYYQAPVGSLYGPTARALQPVPTLGSAPSQLRTSQAPSLNAGATYQPPVASPVITAANESRVGSNVNDPQLSWIPPYANDASRVAPAQYSSPPNYAAPQYTSPPASLPPTLQNNASVGIVPPIGQIPGPPRYASPVVPSFARSSAGCCGPNSDLVYNSMYDSAPAGSVVTYEGAYGAPPVAYGPPIVADTGYSNGYQVADDGWKPRSTTRR